GRGEGGVSYHAFRDSRSESTTMRATRCESRLRDSTPSGVVRAAFPADVPQSWPEAGRAEALRSGHGTMVAKRYLNEPPDAKRRRNHAARNHRARPPAQLRRGERE